MDILMFMDDKITITKSSMTGLLAIQKYNDVVELTKENIIDLKEYFEIGRAHV